MGGNQEKAGQEILETEHRDKEGNIYPVEVTNNFIETRWPGIFLQFGPG